MAASDSQFLVFVEIAFDDTPPAQEYTHRTSSRRKRVASGERRIASRAKAGPGIYYSTHESRVKLLPAAA
jgi:hypothetical protein